MSYHISDIYLHTEKGTDKAASAQNAESNGPKDPGVGDERRLAGLRAGKSWKLVMNKS